MRHYIFGRKLNRNFNQRKALFKGLIISLVKEGRIKTTIAKAKAIKPLIDKIITQAKKNDFNSKRRILKKLGNKEAVNKLISEVLPCLNDRKSGYTKIIKIGKREGDGGETAILEWVNIPLPKEEPKIENKEIEEKNIPKGKNENNKTNKKISN